MQQTRSKLRKNQIVCKGVHTDDFGRVSALRKTGFYAQFKTGHGNRISLFFAWNKIVAKETPASEIDGTDKIMLA